MLSVKTERPSGSTRFLAGPMKRIWLVQKFHQGTAEKKSADKALTDSLTKSYKKYRHWKFGELNLTLYEEPV